MNFGDILEKWEREQPAFQSSAARTWLKDKNIRDADAKETAVPGENRRRLLRLRPDDIIDIHGATGEKARLLLDQFFSNAKECGFEKLRIIHGKGNRSQGEAILRRTVREYIEQCSFAGESGYEKSANGGTGATWVFLRDNS